MNNLIISFREMMLNRNSFILFLFFVSCCVSAQAKDVIKILAVGNSFSENAIEQNLYQLAEKNGDSLVIGNVYYPGCTINRHWESAQNNAAIYQYRKIVGGNRTNTHDKTLLDCILDEDWGYISFQQGSYDSGKYNTYSNLPNLMQYVAGNVTNPQVKYIIHRTWAYAQSTSHTGFPQYNSNQIYMYEAIVDAVSRTVRDINDDAANPNKIQFVVPAGTAIQNGRSSYIGDMFCDTDGYHLNSLGKYTAACTWLEMITGKSAVGNTYKSSNISVQQAEIAQKAAHYAVQNPDEVTSMTISPYQGGSGEFTQLVWNDEFDTDGLPDPAKWSYEKGYIRNNELQYYTEARPENIGIGNGILTITARNDNAYIDGNTREITSASIHTQYKGDWKYGRMEMRAKLPAAIKGNWPAFWMMPTDQVYGWWPKSGEIDIMEHVGYTPQAVFFGAHTQANNHASGGSWTKSWNDNTISTDFHIYAVEWFEDRIDWYFDDTKQYTIYNNGSGWESWPFDQRFYLILNFAFGGSWGGAAGVEKNKLPAEYQIDYVRVFQAENANGSSHIIADFEDAANIGTWVNAGGVTHSIVNNPSKTGINTSDKVIKIEKKADLENWAGVMKKNLNLHLGTDPDSYKYLHFKILKPVSSQVSVCLRTSNGVDENYFSTTNTQTDTWEYLIINVSNVTKTPLAEFFIRPDYVKRNEDITVYVDDILLSNSNVPLENITSVQTSTSGKQHLYVNHHGGVFFDKEVLGNLKIELISMQGRVVENIYTGYANTGNNAFQINGKYNGVFLLRITEDNTAWSQKVVLMH